MKNSTGINTFFQDTNINFRDEHNLRAERNTTITQ